MKIKTHYQLLKLIAYASPALLFGSLHAQENDPFVKEKGGREALRKATLPILPNDKVSADFYNFKIRPMQVKTIFTTFEVFSLPASEAAKLHRLKISDVERYERIVKMVEEKKANLELLSSVLSRTGTPAEIKATQTYRKITELEAAESGASGKTHPKAGRPEAMKAGLSITITGIMGEPGLLIPLTQKGVNILQSRQVANEINDFSPFDGPDTSAGMKNDTKIIFEAIRNKDIRTNNYIDMGFKQSFSELLAPQDIRARGSEFSNPVIETTEINSETTLYIGKPRLLGNLTPASKLKERDRDKKEVWLSFATATYK